MNEHSINNSILQGLNQCDKSAFDRFFNDVFPVVLLYTEKIVFDRYEAEDIALMAFAKLWEKMQTGQLQFKTFPQARAYIFFTAKNDSISFLRKARTWRANSGLFNLYVVGDSQFDPTDKILLEALTVERLYTEIEKLPGKMKDVVKLCYFSNLSRAEVAEKLNLTRNTVDSHVRHAVGKLKNVLSAEEIK